jgi:hypothetical protein
LINEKCRDHQQEVIMPESDSATLVEQLRRAKRRWKAVAIGLSVVLSALLVYAVTQIKLATERAELEQERAARAALEAREELAVWQEKARREMEKAPRP